MVTVVNYSPKRQSWGQSRGQSRPET